MSEEAKDPSADLVAKALESFEKEHLFEPWLKDVVTFSCRHYEEAFRDRGPLTEERLKEEIILGVSKAFRRLVVLVDVHKNNPSGDPA